LHHNDAKISNHHAAGLDSQALMVASQNLEVDVANLR